MKVQNLELPRILSNKNAVLDKIGHFLFIIVQNCLHVFLVFLIERRCVAPKVSLISAINLIYCRN